MKKFLWLSVFLGLNLLSAQEALAKPEVLEALDKLSVNDVFSFNFRHRDDDLSYDVDEDGEMLPPFPGLYRAVSTYGSMAIEPNREHKYVVVELGRNIPNYKTNRSENFREKTILLRRIHPEQKDGEDIFWFINPKNGLIESFEDGHFIGTITGVARFENPRKGG